MSLFAILETYLFTGVTSSAAFTVLQKGISTVFQKTPADLFFDSVDEVVRANIVDLKSLVKDGEVHFRRDKLPSSIPNIGTPLMNSAILSENDVLDQLASVFSNNDLIEIGGHQLDQSSYLDINRKILNTAKHRFYDKLSQNQIAFNRVILAQTEDNSQVLREIQTLLSNDKNIIIDKLTELSEQIQALQNGGQAHTARIEQDQLDEAGIPESLLISQSTHLVIPELLGADEKQNASKTFIPIDYLQSLKDELATKGYVERKEVFQDLVSKLKEGSAIAIVGEPGIGKTFLLARLGEYRQAVYISLKGQTVFQVYSYLVNRIRVLQKEPPLELKSELEVRWQLEAELAKFSIMILLDDVDYEVNIVQQLLSLHRSKAILILATRSTLSLAGATVITYEVPPFSYDEIQALVTNLNIDIELSKYQELRRASHGNPLYLYYFSIEQIMPLPATITAYQEAIWRGLSTTKREVLILLSVSFSPKTLEEIHDIRRFITPSNDGMIGTASLMEETKPLITTKNNKYIIFHPFFSDFIEDKAGKVGLSHHFHKKLADYNLNEDNIFEAAYHLFNANDSRLQDYCLPASTQAINLGYYKLAEKFLQKNLELVKILDDYDTLGLTHFLLAQTYSLISQTTKAEEFAKQAINYFTLCNKDDIVKHIESWYSSTFIGFIDRDTALNKSREVVEYFSGKNPEQEAAALVNLSNILVQLSRFKEGIEIAKRGYEIFKHQDNQEGIIISMTNIAACLGGLDNHQEQIKYARMIIDMAEKLQRIHLKIVGLNHLAMFYRKEGNAKEAVVVLEECISIAQDLGDINRVVLNTNNLGNAYFDLDNFDKAKQCYMDALIQAKEHGFIREQGRSYELLARIESRTGDASEVIRLADEAISLYTQVKDDFRIASTLDYIGWGYKKTGAYLEAAESYQKSAEIYLDFDMLQNAAQAFDDAGRNWLRLQDIEMAKSCLNRGIEAAITSKAIDELASLLEVRSTIDLSATHLSQYLELLRLYTRDSYEGNFASSMFSFAASLKRCSIAEERKGLFQQIVKELLLATTKTHTRCFNALAVLIEQADSKLVDENYLNEVIINVTEVVEGFYYRRASIDHEIYTVALRWKNHFIVQIISWLSDSVDRRIGFVIALILLANRDSLEKNIEQFGEIRNKYFVVNLVTQSEFDAHIMHLSDEDKLTPDYPFTITKSKIALDGPQPEAIAILLDNYSEVADWATYPENQTFIRLLMIFYSSLVEHCIDIDRNDIHREARIFVEEVLQ